MLEAIAGPTKVLLTRMDRNVILGLCTTPFSFSVLHDAPQHLIIAPKQPASSN